MRDQASQLRPFVRAVHRRAVAWVVLESAGLGVAAGCGVAGVLLPLLIWQDRPAVPAIGTILVIAGAIGILRGLMRRPGVLAAAMEIDRQANLHDLLASALMLRSADEPFAKAVLAEANAACMRLSPSEILLRRLGGRTWGGIGLAVAMVLTVAMIWSNPAASVARSSQIAATGGEATRLLDRESAVGNVGGSVNHNPDGTQHGRNTTDEAGDEPGEDATGVRPAQGAPGSANTGGSDSAGSGASVTKAGTTDTRNLGGSGGDRDPAAATGPTGSGGRSMVGAEVGPAAGSRTGGQQPAKPAPPWRSGSWESDRSAALESLSRGAVPDRYRDVVEEYFRRER